MKKLWLILALCIPIMHTPVQAKKRKFDLTNPVIVGTAISLSISIIALISYGIKKRIESKKNGSQGVPLSSTEKIPLLQKTVELQNGYNTQATYQLFQIIITPTLSDKQKTSEINRLISLCADPNGIATISARDGSPTDNPCVLKFAIEQKAHLNIIKAIVENQATVTNEIIQAAESKNYENETLEYLRQKQASGYQSGASSPSSSCSLMELPTAVETP